MKLIDSRYIEKDFKKICEEIDTILRRDEIPSTDLFKRLDSEFKKVKELYELHGDRLNLLFVEHNYLSRKSIQYLKKDPAKSLILFIRSLSKLMERHIAIRPYPQESFKKMIGVYHQILNWIEERIELIKASGYVRSEFTQFIEKYILSNQDIIPDELSDLIVRISIILMRTFERDIDKTKVKSKKDFERIQKLEIEINSIFDILKNLKFIKKSYIPSMHYECLYKLKKKQLHYFVRMIFFESSKEKREKIQSKIDKMAKQLRNFAEQSLKYYEKFLKSGGDDVSESERLCLCLKNLDVFASEYYYYAYSKKDIFKAWQKIDEIKQFIVKKVFKEKIPLSENLISYFGEEWSLLYIFAKIYLLKEEVSRRLNALTQDWERDIFSKIVRNLAELEKLFKYEAKYSKDYTLKIITAQFSGGFSEYFIHELFLEYFDNCVIDSKTPEEFIDLFKCIKNGRKYDIVLNDHPDKKEPDIDIHIKGQCAVFLKNTKIDSEAIKEIEREVRLCSKMKIKKIFYGINFIKNLQNVDYIRRKFEEIETNYPQIQIQIFDIKDLVSILIKELERHGRTKPSFSEFDLYKVLDY